MFQSHVVLILTQRQAEFVRWGILRKTGKHYKSSYVTSRGHCSGGNFQNTAQNQNCWKHPQSRLSLRSITVWKSDYMVSYTVSLERASSRDTFQSVSHSCTHSGSCLASSWYQTTDNPSQLTLLLNPQPKFATPLLSESFQDIFSYKIKKNDKKKRNGAIRLASFLFEVFFLYVRRGEVFSLVLVLPGVPTQRSLVCKHLWVRWRGARHF